ncbi:phosphoribosyltransferase [Actinophytocola glycyrrhizae]|uniref:Phosphoribosyltransferase n=1 Tax=Actinophytocola glycyrrhizae TaxID=2044873 RepID=A0ABV9RYC1_9PSEU
MTGQGHHGDDASRHLVADALTQQLYTAVGAFFCNTRRGAQNICPVCTGPAAMRSLCGPCHGAKETYGSSLADLVVPLAYAKARMPSMHQSAHHVRAYKASPPAPKCAQDLRFMAAAATFVHGRCIAATTGQWHAVTFVPSAARPGGEHPVADIARAVHGVHDEAAKVALSVGPGLCESPARAPRPDRFVVPATYQPFISGRHVLVVDDTWVSGAKSQSAAIALKNVGAAHVTVLCVTRWLRYDWDDHRQLIETLDEPYNAMRCPVTGGDCP